MVDIGMRMSLIWLGSVNSSYFSMFTLCMIHDCDTIGGEREKELEKKKENDALLLTGTDKIQRK